MTADELRVVCEVYYQLRTEKEQLAQELKDQINTANDRSWNEQTKLRHFVHALPVPVTAEAMAALFAKFQHGPWGQNCYLCKESGA